MLINIGEMIKIFIEDEDNDYELENVSILEFLLICYWKKLSLFINLVLEVFLKIVRLKKSLFY